MSTNTVSSLYRLFKHIKPQVVHTHHIGPLIYGATAARLAGIKHIVHTEHDAWHLNNPKHRLLQNIVLKFSRPQVVADADVVKNQLDSQLSYDRVAVIRNGVDCERFSPGNKNNARTNLGLTLNDTIIGSAGRLEHVKGHDLLLKALPLVHSSVKLVIAGDGTQREALTKMAKDLSISDRVYFLGLVGDMPNFYRALDVFCLPSRCEGFPSPHSKLRLVVYQPWLMMSVEPKKHFAPTLAYFHQWVITKHWQTTLTNYSVNNRTVHHADL